MEIVFIPQLSDNYSYLLLSGGKVAVVDPSEAGPVRDILDARGLGLDYILNTHHHWDHTDGNLDLKDEYGCEIVGPAAEADRIPGIDTGLREGDRWTLGNAEARIIETPGHTSGHICFYFAREKALFSGDTLFSLGCGGLFEGTAEQMWNSLCKLMTLPDDTLIYCGHEYTLACGRRCLAAEPDNEALKRRLAEAKDKKKQGLPTLPVTLKSEKETNVFLRAGSAERFAEIRATKS